MASNMVQIQVPQLKKENYEKCMVVTPPKLALTNPMESLAIHSVEPTRGQTGNHPCKNLSE
jgi:hypothetical protein